MENDTGTLESAPKHGPFRSEERDRKRRARAARYQRERRRRNQIVGPLQIESELVVAALRTARDMGFTNRAIAALAGCNEDTVRRIATRPSGLAYRDTAMRLLEAMEKLATAKRMQLDDLDDQLEALAGRLYPARRWEAEPLREAVRASGVAVQKTLRATDRRYLYRSRSMTTERADALCLALGLMPEEVWGQAWMTEVDHRATTAYSAEPPLNREGSQ